MIYGSVCSGIEAATVAWEPLGWKAAFYSEIDAFPCALLKHYYSDVPNHGDMTRFKDWPDAAIDALVGGTPCQSFSVAGLRKGLDDPRGNLTLIYLAVARKYRPRWLVWENVLGVLSDGSGAFGAFLGGLGQLGYGFAYRVLDAQYFGVPQRRRRVFVVGHLGDWRRAAAVLFERASLRGDSAPRRQSREGVAPTIAARTRGGGGLGTDFDCDGGLVHPALAARDYKSARPEASGAMCIAVSHALDSYSAGRATEDGTGRGVPLVAHSLRADGFDAGEDGTGRKQQTYIAFGQQNSARQGASASASVTPTLDKSKVPGLGYGMQVRRLTPRECERLQGFQDDYTLIPYRNKLAADGPRYKALGNSMAVPVMSWIGERIAAVDAIKC